MSLEPRSRELTDRRDHRGSLVKVLMRLDLCGQRKFGEIYVTTTIPGQVRGNHYHRRTTEWFYVVAGSGRLVTRRMDNGEIREFDLSMDEPCIVEVPSNVAHAMQNMGDEPLILLVYADEPYDPGNPDELPVQVISAD